MKELRAKVAIVGVGTAGMTAWRQISKSCSDFVLINGGSYGTTCARVGCMPSKLFIQAANDFYRRNHFEELGIRGAESLSVDTSAVLRRVRKFRDRFVGGVLKSIEAISESKKIEGYAEFEEPGVLRVNNTRVIADKIILAVGGRPIVPRAWESLKEKIVTSDEFFELNELPSSCAVVGNGVIGLELGQAMSRLGVRTKLFGGRDQMALLTDPEINQYARKIFEAEFREFQLNHFAEPQDVEGFEKVLMAPGRRSNLDQMQIENSGAQLDERGIPRFNENTMQVEGAPSLFIAGDTTGDRQLLHEAADEGRIAGFNALADQPSCFQRRTKLGIVFTDPTIMTCGRYFSELEEFKMEYAIGRVSFEGQGRALVAAKNKGLLHVYGRKSDGLILGAEMFGPDAEHLGHLLSWAIQSKMTAHKILEMPFYHPVIEEGLRTAIRDLASQVNSPHADLEFLRCEVLDHE